MIARVAIIFCLVVVFLGVPALFALLSRWLAPKRYRKWITLACTLFIWGVAGYGYFWGFEELEVRQVEYVSADLPKSFDGYRIVQFSDAHVGTFKGSRQWMMKRAVDMMNAQKADAIVFTGDMQNLYPDDIEPHLAVLRQLRAPDGVYGVLGNHDYAIYIDADSITQQRNDARTVQLMRQTGWTLLLNEHRIIRRDSDSIVIAGMENWGKMKRMPRKGDVKKTLAGLTQHPSNKEEQGVGSPFIVMLSHDPSAWREKILPESHAQLTLSGHTHGGQFSLFGWSPVAWSYDEWDGMTYEGSRAIFVSAGVGALIPFRLGKPGEIVVITLRSKK